MPWPIGRPRSEGDLLYARAQIEGLVQNGVVSDTDSAADLLLTAGEIDPHAHARLLSRRAREARYGSAHAQTLHLITVDDDGTVIEESEHPMPSDRRERLAWLRRLWQGSDEPARRPA